MADRWALLAALGKEGAARYRRDRTQWRRLAQDLEERLVDGTLNTAHAHLALAQLYYDNLDEERTSPVRGHLESAALYDAGWPPLLAFQKELGPDYAPMSHRDPRGSAGVEGSAAPVAIPLWVERKRDDG